jgi:hypothetical protein
MMDKKVNAMRKLNSKILFIAVVFPGLLFLCQCTPMAENSEISPGKTTYYIDPVKGDDENSGLRESRAWRTFSHISQLQLAPGDRVDITSPGSFDQTLILRGEGTTVDPVEVHFAAGRYDFFTDNITRKKYNISNTNSQPDSLKAIGILLEGAKHFNIRGPGAEIFCRGKMIEVCIDSCENITISGLHFDYHRPTVSEFQVVEVGEDYVDLQIHKDSEYRIEDGDIIWYGEGWTSHTRILGQELDLETNDVRRLWNPIEGMQFEEIKPDLVRARGEHKVKKDHIYQLRETFRDYAAVFTRRSKNISWKDVDFCFLHGMGLVSQFSENLTYEVVSFAPDSTSGRTTAAWADILHVSGCKGRVLVKDCIFKGAHDDAINIHGTYLQVVEKISENQIKLRFMHHQTYGFLAVNPGDEIEFIDGESYESHGLNRVIDARLLSPKEILVKLEKSVPRALDLRDVIENVTWTPEVEIRGCHVSWIPTRGFLLATRKKVLVEENEFLATHMSAILIGIDANKWFESGYVRDMTIRNNRFIHCAEPVIHIEPMNSKSNNRVHQNIRIENNRFLLSNQLVLKAKSASNIIVTGNTIVSEKKQNDEAVIMTSDCAGVKVGENNYLIGSE